ncbi:hypothetical protein NDI56_14690 [Haloarcula sp. S1CR25-12]|uniref:DUF7282 domain-containing protein n=1 Tax=Haloarcula saliterrae TaxID=2950534 RepID=A0ABU2FEF7_9EURY|nr:hypothetical protein [Haloarcula sp. S1CR25-12]MDS0260651.1 hypothetical protein [Haloarcula sp. S1CR25-12]
MTDETTDESGDATARTDSDWELPSRLTARRDILKTGAAASAVLGVGFAGATGGLAQEGDDAGNETETVAEQASVSFLNQPTDGTAVTVESVTVPEGGYVTVHDATLLDGAVVESVIGVSDYLDPGAYEAVEVDLYEVPGGSTDQSALEETQALFAMPHEETTDNESYDFVESGGESDGPYVREGQAVVDVGYAVVDGAANGTATPENATATPENATATPENATATPTDAADGEASVTFLNQSTDGTTVTVAAVTLPEGGYVAVHDVTLLDGAVVESVIGVSEYLEPGSYVDGEITLYEVPGAEFDQSALEETQALIAMPHEETTDNESYDFVESGGESDGPYVQAGQPVVTAAYASVDEEAETATPDGETDTPEGNETDTPEDNETAPENETA